MKMMIDKIRTAEKRGKNSQELRWLGPGLCELAEEPHMMQCPPLQC